MIVDLQVPVICKVKTSSILDVVLKLQAIAFTWMSEIGRCHVHGFSCPTIADLMQCNPLDQL